MRVTRPLFMGLGTRLEESKVKSHSVVAYIIYEDMLDVLAGSHDQQCG